MNAAWPLFAFLLLAGCNDLTEHDSKPVGRIAVYKLTLVHVAIGPQEIGRGEQFDKVDFSSDQWKVR